MTGLGFSSSGIAAASTAAGIQAGIGNIVAGSAFAAVQSLGALGAFAIMGLVGGIALLLFGAIYVGYKIYQFVQEKNAKGKIKAKV
jgi:hypothetical protein